MRILGMLKLTAAACGLVLTMANAPARAQLADLANDTSAFMSSVVIEV
jgi:hypothetical protein